MTSIWRGVLPSLALVSIVWACGGATDSPFDASGGSGNAGGKGGAAPLGGNAGASSGGAGGVGGSNPTGGSSSGGSGTSGGAAGTNTGGKNAGGKAGTGGNATGGQSAGGTSGAGGAAGGGSGGSGGASGSGTSGAGGGGSCAPSCREGRDCCGARCVNLANDPFNCGRCGLECPSDTYCGGGSCVPPPCQATCDGNATCCGSSCCGAGELCCDPQGPIDTEPRCLPPSDQGTCPQGCAPLCNCASPDTPIATPSGARGLASLRVGDLVYTIDQGKLVAAPVLRTNRTPATAHRVVRVTLASGFTLEISGAHPTADGRLWSDLRPGDTLDGVEVERTTTIPYGHDATYDILPASDTGAYYAGGVLIGSTLAKAPVVVTEASAPASLTVTGAGR